jgi:hypothetical protein
VFCAHCKAKFPVLAQFSIVASNIKHHGVVQETAIATLVPYAASMSMSETVLLQSLTPLLNILTAVGDEGQLNVNFISGAVLDV